MDPTNDLEPNSSHLIRNVLVITFIIIVIFVSIDLVLVFKKLANNVNKQISDLDKPTSVTLKTQYDNPFDKKSQYSNPFSQSQNPFDNLAQ